uniref:Uncharacterized protein n=2 Tax=Caenorhabditis japonica TaxID=281687 RepID=A0A8R1DU67_CAEJA
MDTNEIYLSFLSYFYPSFFCLGILAQIVLLFMILRHTPQTMSILRAILANTSICQLCLLVHCCASQFRMITTDIPVVLRSYGPAHKYFKPWVMYALHQSMQLLVIMSGMSIIVTFYFKYAIVCNKNLSTAKKFMIFLLFHIPAMISGTVEVIMVFTQALPQEIQDMYATMNEGVSDYSVIGILSLYSLPSRINFLCVVGPVFSYSIVAFFLRYKILKMINDGSTHASDTRKIQHQSFTMGLTIQAVLPVVFYIPVFSLYLYCLSTREEILFQQYFQYINSSLPTLVDPLVSLYFVTPYRDQIKYRLGVKPKIPVKPLTIAVALV